MFHHEKGWEFTNQQPHLCNLWSYNKLIFLNIKVFCLVLVTLTEEKQNQPFFFLFSFICIWVLLIRWHSRATAELVWPLTCVREYTLPIMQYLWRPVNQILQFFLPGNHKTHYFPLGLKLHTLGVQWLVRFIDSLAFVLFFQLETQSTSTSPQGGLLEVCCSEKSWPLLTLLNCFVSIVLRVVFFWGLI